MRWTELQEKISPAKLEKYLTKEDILMGFEFEFIAEVSTDEYIPKPEEHIIELNQTTIVEIASDFYNYTTLDPRVWLNPDYRRWLRDNNEEDNEDNQKWWIHERGHKNLIKEFTFYDDIRVEFEYGKARILKDDEHYDEDEIDSLRREEVGRIIERSLHLHSITVLNSAHAKEKDANTWYLEPDSSIDYDAQSEIGVELVTPAFVTTEEAFYYLDECLDIISKIGYTNNSTALHVNISLLNNAQHKIDPLKLVMLLGENYVGKIFGREMNTYAEQQIRVIQDKLSKSPDLTEKITQAIKHNDYQTVNKLLSKIIEEAKYRSVNIYKDYFEFRLIGSEGYHFKEEEIKDSILRFIHAMQLASDPNASKHTFLKKLGKLITQLPDFLIKSNYVNNEKVKNDLLPFNKFYTLKTRNNNYSIGRLLYTLLKNLLIRYHNNDAANIQSLFKDIFRDLVELQEHLDITFTARQVKILRNLAKFAGFNNRRDFENIPLTSPGISFPKESLNKLLDKLKIY